MKGSVLSCSVCLWAMLKKCELTWLKHKRGCRTRGLPTTFNTINQAILRVFWLKMFFFLFFFWGGGTILLEALGIFWVLIFLPIRSSPPPSVEISTPWDFSPLLRIILVGLASNYPACWLKEWGAKNTSFGDSCKVTCKVACCVEVLHHKLLDFF